MQYSGNQQASIEEMRRERERLVEELRRQQEELRRQQEEQRRRMEEQRRATQAGQAQQVGLGGVNPGMVQSFIGGGGGGALAGGATSGGAAAGSGGAAGGAASGGAAGGSSALGSAGPWGLLAAAIIANELQANKAGRRPESKSEWARDLITGKVVEHDMDYYGDKVGGFGGEVLKGVGQLGNPEGVFNLIKRAFK